LLTLRIIYKFFQSHFPGPYRLFWRICLQNLVFRISCVGKDLAGFQKLLFWTPDIITHPSPVSLLRDIFVKPKTASREPYNIALIFFRFVINFIRVSCRGPWMLIICTNIYKDWNIQFLTNQLPSAWKIFRYKFIQLKRILDFNHLFNI
jgi:hypothetical protein